jgi:predicted kinase
MPLLTKRETIVDVLINQHRVAIFLIGTPGSGKTTFARQYAKKLRIINADSVMEKMLHGNYLRHPQVTACVYPEAQTVAQLQLYQSIINGDSFLYDDTGIDVVTNKETILEAKNNGYLIGLTFLRAPLAVCLRRNRQRERYVPDERLFEIHKKMSFVWKELYPLADYYEVISTYP